MIKESTELLLNVQGVAFIGVLAVIIIVSLVQWLSKKHEPWKVFFTFIGKQINKETNSRLDTIDGRITQLEAHNVEQDQRRLRDRAESARREIILAADEICVMPTHTEEWYNDILHQISDYEGYCKSHPEFPNAQAILSIDIIRASYKEHKVDGSFFHKLMP